MSDNITSSIVRLINRKGEIAGLGHLVPGNRVITCAHVVAQALEIPTDATPPPDSEIEVDLPFGELGGRRKARVCAWRTIGQTPSPQFGGLSDLAVLEILDVQPVSAGINAPNDDDYGGMIDAIVAGELIPFLGAGVNLCDRPEGEAWCRDSQFLPSGAELSRALASEFDYPWNDNTDLLRVSQYVALMHTLGRLYESLRSIFDKDYPSTALHSFFANLPRLLRERNYPSSLLIVTTNYDDLLERAFRDVKQPYDLVTYWVGDQNEQRGKLLHWTAQGRPQPIEDPNTYDGIKLDTAQNLVNPVILKVHGAVDRTVSRAMRPRDSYVITEDHYLDYLTRSDISALVPATLKAKFANSSFLFLGYSLRDWNLRVFLNRIQMQQRQALQYHRMWAIQKQPVVLEQKFWEARGVEILDANLREYVAELDKRIKDLPPR
jgi:hypothetical protein